jgi:hypothetical protein
VFVVALCAFPNAGSAIFVSLRLLSPPLCAHVFMTADAGNKQNVNKKMRAREMERSARLFYLLELELFEGIKRN